MKTERELYQEHYKTSRDYKFYIKHEMTEKQVFEFKGGKYVVECVNDGWKIWQASAKREGYKLVPVNPTDEMINTYRDKSIAPISTLSVIGYKAMIGAADE